MTHVRQLLREIIRREEVDARFAEFMRNNNSKELAFMDYLFDHLAKIPFNTLL